MLRRHPLGQKNLTTPRRWCFLPGNMDDANGSGLLAIACPFRFFGKVDNQLLRLNLNARDLGINEASVVNRLGRFDVLPDRFDD